MASTKSFNKLTLSKLSKEASHRQEQPERHAHNEPYSCESARGHELECCLLVLACFGGSVALVQAVQGQDTQGAAAEETGYTR